LPGCLNARTPCIPVRLVTGLGVDDILLRAIDGKEAAGAVGALSDGRVELPAETVVEGEAGRDLPGVLEIGVDVVTVDGGGADVGSVREIGRRNGHGINEWTAGQEAGERVGQRIAG
jgi:hypothetical protein